MIKFRHIVVIELCVLPNDMGKFPHGIDRSSVVPVDERYRMSVSGQDVPRSEVAMTNY
jgi:hypothetical protein